MFRILRDNVYARIALYVALAIILGGAYLFFDPSIPRLPRDPPLDLRGVMVLNLSGDSFKTIPLGKTSTKTFFDFDNDSFAEQTSWLTPGDGFLAIDENRDSEIGPSEMFGSAVDDGYAAMSRLDTNKDRKLDNRDAAWSDLVVWQDKNSDARSQNDELVPISSLAVRAINLKPRKQREQAFVSSTVKSSDRKRISVALFKPELNQTNTYYIGEYTIDTRVLFLPTLRGYGELPNLDVAMSLNTELLQMVQQFVAGWSLDAFADPQGTRSSVEGILYTWAGVADIPVESCGPSIDARILSFLEKFFGNKFLQKGIEPNPGPNAARKLYEAWYGVYPNLQAQLLVQAGAKKLFKRANYNPWTGNVEGDMSIIPGTVESLKALAAAGDAAVVWTEVADFIQHTKGLRKMTPEEAELMAKAAHETGVSWAQITETVVSKPTSVDE